MSDLASVSDPAEALKEALNRVMRHQRAGRHRAALDLLASLEADQGPLPEILHLKGMNLHALGQRDAGMSLIEEAIEMLPAHAGFVADLGALLAQAGRIDEAIPCFEKATDLAPHYAGGWTNLGAAHFLKEDYRAAIPCLLKAVQLEPTLLDAQRNLGIAFLQAQRFRQAAEVFYRALSLDPNDAAAHTQLSAALYRLERHDSAIHHAEKAIELAPDAPEPRLHLGNALASVGRMAEAEAQLVKASSVMPQGIPALARLIHLRKTTKDSFEFRALERLTARLDRLPPRAGATLHMAAGKAHADLGDYETAFHHLSAGNALTAAEHGFDLQNHVAQVDRMIAVATADWISGMTGRAGVQDVAPIFVCGMPRSGTTLMELMLSRHSRVQAGGELGAARAAIGQSRHLVDILEERAEGRPTADDIDRVGEAYVAALRAEGLAEETVTDKLPINYLYIGVLAPALPRARFIVMRRHPMDCCLSNWMQDFGRNQPFSTDFHNLGQVYLQQRRITDHWAALMPDRVRIVDYESVIASAEETMRQVLDFCGLAWEPAVLDHAASGRAVNTASLSQVRQPLYTSSVAGWRRYGALLGPLARELAPLLSAEDLRAAGVAAPR